MWFNLEGNEWVELGRVEHVHWAERAGKFSVTLGLYSNRAVSANNLTQDALIALLDELDVDFTVQRAILAAGAALRKKKEEFGG